MIFSSFIPPCGYVYARPARAALIGTQILISHKQAVYNWCLRKIKTGWKFKQSWCWDFVVSKEVFELLLISIWLQLVTCSRTAVRVLPFPGGSTGESGQESAAKQSPFKRRLEQSNVNIEKCHQNPKVSGELNSQKECCFPEFLCKWLWLLGKYKLYQELVGLVGKNDNKKVLTCYSCWSLVVQPLKTSKAVTIPRRVNGSRLQWNK